MRRALTACGPAKVPGVALLVALAASPAAAQPAPVEVAGTESARDAAGRYTVELTIPDMPVMGVQYGSEWEGVYVYRLPGDVTVRRVRTFLGVDRGHVWEGHVLVTVDGFYLVTRSPHKENISGYDAWSAERTEYRTPAEGADLYVFGLARPTLKGKPVNYHLGVILELAP